MKKITSVLLLTLTAVFASTQLNAQTKIKDGTVTGSSSLPVTAAILQLESNNKGLLMPLIALTNTTTWGLTGTSVNGMIVYNTATTITSTNTSYPIIPGGVGVYYWDGTGWVATSPAATSANYWGLKGNSGTNGGINFLGTTDNHPLKFKVDNTLAGFLDSVGGAGNTFYGLDAGINNLSTGSTGSGNTFIGYYAGTSNTNGVSDFFSGSSAGYSNTTGSYNVFMGALAGYSNTTGTQNSYAGFGAGRWVTTGLNNTAFGQAALSASGSAVVVNNNNTAVGSYALYGTTTGSNNVSVGSSANDINTTGSYNVAIGNSAMHGANGSNDVVIGESAGGGNSTAYTYSTLLGYNANTTGANSTSLTNATAIGAYAAVGASNTMVLGGTGTYAVSVGIGTTTPNSVLQVVGSVSTNIVSVTASYTLTAADYTVIFKGASTAPTFTLPDPTTCKGRMYRIINAAPSSSYQNINLSRPVYLTSGLSSTVVAITTYTVSEGLADPTIGNTCIIQSDGSIWWRIGL